jgi:hypothetical protein
VDWVTVTPEEGNGNSLVKIEVLYNPNSELRNAKLTFTAEGLAPVEVYIQQGKNTALKADPYPTKERVEVNSEETTEYNLTNREDFLNKIYSKIGDDASQWGGDYQMNLLFATSPVGSGESFEATIVEKIDYKTQNVVFGDFSNGTWFSPDNKLTITRSELKETSISTSIEASIGLGIQGLSASLKKTTTTTYTQAQTLAIENEYDLTQYEQDKVYMAVLMGTIRVGELGVTVKVTVMGIPVTYSITIPFVEVVNQPGDDSLRIKLVQQPK